MSSSTGALWGGVLAILGGIVALLFPLPTGLAITAFTGIAFLISGALGLFTAFRDSTMQHRLWLGLFSALQLVFGVMLLADPLAGLVSLTVIAGMFFVFSGAVRAMLAFQLRGKIPFWPVLISAILSLALGFYTLFFPIVASGILLGTLLAIELLLIGSAFISMGLALKRK